MPEDTADTPLPASRPSIVITGVQTLTPHSQAVLEAGKSLLVDAVETSREFCKFQIGMSSGAVPVYIALLKLILPDGYRFTLLEGSLYLLPGGFFLASAVVAALGFIPAQGIASLDVIEEIERHRDRIIKQRTRFGMAAFVLFAIGMLVAMVSAVVAMATIAISPVVRFPEAG